MISTHVHVYQPLNVRTLTPSLLLLSLLSLIGLDQNGKTRVEEMWKVKEIYTLGREERSKLNWNRGIMERKIVKENC